jgi:hypothetical protein
MQRITQYLPKVYVTPPLHVSVSVHTPSSGGKQCVHHSTYETGQGYQPTAREKIPLARGIHCCPKSCLFLLPLTVCTLCGTCVYTHTHTHKLYMNYRETFLHRAEWYEVLTGYLPLGRRSGGDWANTRHWAERFTDCFWTGSGSSAVTDMFFTYRISWGAFVRDIIQ